MTKGNHSIDKATDQPLLELKNLSKYFSQGKGRRKTLVKAVDDISFSIATGETFGLVGESGCGKTTTGRTIIRLYDPTGGDVFFKGENIAGPMDKKLRNYITYGMQMIFQDPISSLNPRMTVQEIIGEGLKINKLCENEDEIIERVFEMLEVIGLTKEHASRYPHEFSGGQRQRIGVARSIITNPQLIIADEPVSALDVSIQAQILNLLKDMQADLDLTILFIAHDLSVVKYFSDRIAVMYYGNIVEIGSSEEIYNNPIHPYTVSLLSAIPKPDPIAAKKKKRIFYKPELYNFAEDIPTMAEITTGHMALVNEKVLDAYEKRK